MRPFPNEEIAKVVKCKSCRCSEKDISFRKRGYSLHECQFCSSKAGISILTSDYIGGLGGRNISPGEIENIFEELKQENQPLFLGIEVR